MKITFKTLQQQSFDVEIEPDKSVSISNFTKFTSMFIKFQNFWQ